MSDSLPSGPVVEAPPKRASARSAPVRTAVKYLCTYRFASGRRFSSEVIATPETLDTVLASRNIGEVTDSAPSPRPPFFEPLSAMLERNGATPKVLHYAVFVGWLAIKSGVATVDDILGDCGLVHELAHCLQEVDLVARDFAEIVEMAHRIERAVPGYSWTDIGGDQ